MHASSWKFTSFFLAAVVFLCSYSGTRSTWNTRRGWRNQPTSYHGSKDTGKRVSCPPQGPVAGPYLCERCADLMQHLQGRHEGRNTKILCLLVPHQLLTSPSGVWVACTRDLDYLSTPGLSRAWSFRDLELLQHLFTLCGVMKHCWGKIIIQTATEGEGQEEKYCLMTMKVLIET